MVLRLNIAPRAALLLSERAFYRAEFTLEILVFLFELNQGQPRNAVAVRFKPPSALQISCTKEKYMFVCGVAPYADFLLMYFSHQFLTYPACSQTCYVVAHSGCSSVKKVANDLE